MVLCLYLNNVAAVSLFHINFNFVIATMKPTL